MNTEIHKETLKKAFYQNVITVEELSKWLEYLDGNPMVRSSTSEDEYLEFINTVTERLADKNDKFDKRKADRELNKILRGEKITRN